MKKKTILGVFLILAGVIIIPLLLFTRVSIQCPDTGGLAPKTGYYYATVITNIKYYLYQIVGYTLSGSIHHSMRIYYVFGSGIIVVLVGAAVMIVSGSIILAKSLRRFKL